MRLGKYLAIPKEINWNEIDAFVVYRSKYTGVIKHLICEAKKNNVPVFYDIDDYIFEYNEISELSFLNDEKENDFEEYSNLLKKSMDASDGIIVSTNNLNEAVMKSFNDKKTFINRNVASSEMLILSRLALKRKKYNCDKIVLGYFSGSNTHNDDFKLIENVLFEIMKNDNRVHLKVVGCLVLPEAFENFEDRIISVGFIDWKELPNEIAGVDINLMPLENTFFNRCKSENKWMESALVKVPTIASYNDEIESSTISNENILLCEDEEEWLNKLELLINSLELREKIAENAYKFVINNKVTSVKDVSIINFILGRD